MTAQQHSAGQVHGDAPVTRLELFFDLVFVYLVTQLTELIVTSDGVRDDLLPGDGDRRS